MYPNPASNKVTISFSLLPEIGTKITLMDMIGKELLAAMLKVHMKQWIFSTYLRGCTLLKPN